MSSPINAGSGGGIHPGAPVIWPEGKSEPIQKTSSVAQTGEVKGGVASAGTSQAEMMTPEQKELMESVKQALVQQQTVISRKMAPEDLKRQLVDVFMRSGISATKENQEVALMMLQQGLELSPKNVAKVKTFAQAIEQQTIAQNGQTTLTATGKQASQVLNNASQQVLGQAQEMAKDGSVKQFLNSTGGANASTLVNGQLEQEVLGGNLLGRAGLLSKPTLASEQKIPPAINAVLKGLDQDAATTVAKFFNQNMQVAQQNSDVKSSMKNLQNIITDLVSGNKSPALTSLSAQVSFLSEKWDKIFTKSPGKDFSIASFSKSGIIEDLNAAKSTITGAKNELVKNVDPNSRDISMMFGKLLELEEKLDGLLKNYTSQSILSKNNAKLDPSIPEQFAYWQMPNFMATPPSSLEILIQKDSKKKGEINPKDTVLIMKMQTKELGEIAVELKIKENDVNCRFNTEAEESQKTIYSNLKEFKEQLSKQDFKLKSVQVRKKILETKKMLMPVIDLDNLTRVRANA